MNLPVTLIYLCKLPTPGILFDLHNVLQQLVPHFDYCLGKTLLFNRATFTLYLDLNICTPNYTKVVTLWSLVNFSSACLNALRTDLGLSMILIFFRDMVFSYAKCHIFHIQ